MTDVESMALSEEPDGGPQRLTVAGWIVAALIVAFVVFAVVVPIVHYVTTPPHPCYDQFSGGVTTCH